MIAVWVVIGIAVYIVVLNCWDRFCEVLWPFKYKGVPLSELEDHFNEFARRGNSGARMVVVAEGTTDSIWLRKTIGASEGGITLHLIASGSSEQGDPVLQQRKLRSILEENEFSFDYGLGGFARNPYGLIVECGSDPHTAALVARVMFLDFYGLSQAATYEVWVRGDITWRDAVIDKTHSEGWGTVMKALGGGYAFGRPYKRSHAPKKSGLFYMLGCVIGMVTRSIRRLFGG